MPAQKIADAFLTDGGNANRSIRTYPGGRVDFRGNQATVRDPRDIVHLLRMEGVSLHFDPERVDWLPGWIDQCGPRENVKAEITLPPGYSLKKDGTLKRPKFEVQGRPAEEPASAFPLEIRDIWEKPEVA